MIDIKSIENLINQSYKATSGLLAAKYVIKQKSLKNREDKEKSKKTTQVQEEQVEQLKLQLKKKAECIDRIKIHMKIKEANRDEDDKHRTKLSIKTLKSDVEKIKKKRDQVMVKLQEEQNNLAKIRQEKSKLENERHQMMKQNQIEKDKINKAPAPVVDFKKVIIIITTDNYNFCLCSVLQTSKNR